MGLPLSELILFLRAMIDDIDGSVLQEYTDEQLVNPYLRLAAKLESAEWDQGYLVQLNEDDPINPYYEIVPSPPEWMQILIVTRAALGMREWKEKYSFDNGVIKVTNSNIKDVIEGLRITRNAILQERKYSTVGYVFSTWDDFFTRPQLILNEIDEGYR